MSAAVCLKLTESKSTHMQPTASLKDAIEVICLDIDVHMVATPEVSSSPAFVC